MARLAAESDAVDERNEVQYFRLPCRSVLNKCANEAMPFAYTINPYRGCEFGCAYCFARYTHEYMGLEEWLDFERHIYIKEEAANVLARELKPEKLTGHPIVIGTVTDPYQPAERRHRVTRQLLEVLARHRGLTLSLTTKSALVLRDVDLLQELHRRHHLTLHVTIITADRALCRRIEPRAPTPEKRFQAVRGLAEAGLCVGVFAVPLLPFITDREEDLDALLRACAEAGAQFVVGEMLRLRSSARKRFEPWLEEHFPEYAPAYRRFFADGSRLGATYSEGVLERFARLRNRHGLPDRPPTSVAPTPAPPREQLALGLEWE
jgi:DNA repair photolyase